MQHKLQSHTPTWLGNDFAFLRYLHVVLAGISESADERNAEKQVVEEKHGVVDDRKTDEQKRRRRKTVVVRRPEYDHRHRVSFNTTSTAPFLSRDAMLQRGICYGLLLLPPKCNLSRRTRLHNSQADQVSGRITR